MWNRKLGIPRERVKEDIQLRWGELGVSVSNGQVDFTPDVLRGSEFLEDAQSWTYTSLHVEDERLDVPARSLAFTIYGVPVIYKLTSNPPAIAVHLGCVQQLTRHVLPCFPGSRVPGTP